MDDLKPSHDSPTEGALPEAPFPELIANALESEIVAKLEQHAKRGKLAGFAHDPRGIFAVAAHGSPYDASLVAHADPAPDNDKATRVTFTLHPHRKVPIIMAAVIAFSIWPGVLLTDSILRTWFTFYSNWANAGWASINLPILGPFEWFTWAWYIPLTILPVPWFWKNMNNKAKTSTHASAHEAITKIATVLDAEIKPAS